MFLQDTPGNWCIQVHFFANAAHFFANAVHLFAIAHNTQPLPHLHVAPYEMSFHTQSLIPKKFQVNLSTDKFRECSEQCRSDLQARSHF